MSHGDAPLIQKDHHKTFEVPHHERDFLIMKNARNYELQSDQPQASDQLLSLAHSYKSIYEVLDHSYSELIFETEYLVAPTNQAPYGNVLTLHSLFQSSPEKSLYSRHRQREDSLPHLLPSFRNEHGRLISHRDSHLPAKTSVQAYQFVS